MLPTRLNGSGTIDDPYQITSFEDYESLGLSPNSDSEKGLYFRLDADINTKSSGKLWTGRDLNEGYLDLNGHQIYSPTISYGGYLFRNGTIYSKAEEWNTDGSVAVEGKGGYIVDVHGENVRGVLIECTLNYIYVDTNKVNKWTSGNNPLFHNITAKGCYFRIYSDNIEVPFFSGNINSSVAFTDCCFDISGALIDVPVMRYVGNDRDTTAVLCSKCLFKGYVTLDEMKKGIRSTTVDFVYNGVSQCVFDIQSSYPIDGQGYHSYAGSYTGVNVGLPSTYDSAARAQKSNTIGFNVYTIGDVTEVSNTDILDPDELIDAGMDLLKYVEE